MLLLLLGIGVLIVAIFIIISIKENDEDFCAYGIGVGGVLFIIPSLIAGIVLGGCLVSLRVIPNKIEIIQTQNEETLNKVNAVIESYCEYEDKMFSKLDLDNIAFAFSIYPDLKANTLIEGYIKAIQDNNNEIKELKLEQTNESIYKWWLYFGE